MKCLYLSVIFVIAAITVPVALAQQGGPCGENDVPICDPMLTIAQGAFSATPLMDGVCDANSNCQSYGDPDGNVVSLYGSFGNDESHPLGPNAQRALDHYNMGIIKAGNIRPLCTDGSTSSPCPDGQPQSIIFLFLLSIA